VTARHDDGAGGGSTARPAKSFDLREETTVQSLIRGVIAITATEDVLVQIIADTPFRPGTEIEFVMHRAPLSQALRELDGPDAWLTLLVASAVGLILYVAMLHLLVRPMRRLTSSIAAFRADPEHGVPFDPRAATARRDDEISAAGRELAAMQRELRAALWRNNRLAALGTVVAKVSHDVRGIPESHAAAGRPVVQARRSRGSPASATRWCRRSSEPSTLCTAHSTSRATGRRRRCSPQFACGRWWRRRSRACAARWPCSISTTAYQRTRRSRQIATICSACW